MGSGDDYTQICTLLNDEFCCLTVDLPGHGNTKVMGGAECYTMSQTARGLMKLLDRLKIDKCFLVGYSMGGRLALYLTIHFPKRFSQVILESSSPGLKTAQDRLNRRKADEELAQKLENSSFKSFLIQWYHRPLFTSLTQHSDFEQLIERRMQQNPKELAKSLRSIGTGNQPSLWEQLPKHSVPLLLLVGECDDKFTQINANLAQNCPAAQLEIIPHTGHNIHFENPGFYLKKLINYFRSSDCIGST